MSNERLTHPRQSGIKTGYWTEHKKDELTQRLGQYEDTGLSPEEIKATKCSSGSEKSDKFLAELEEALDREIRHGMLSYTSKMCFIAEELTRSAGTADELTFSASEIKRALDLAKKKSAQVGKP